MNFPLQLAHVRILNHVLGWNPPNCQPNFGDILERLRFFAFTELIETFHFVLKNLYSPYESHILKFAVSKKFEGPRILAGECHIARNDRASSVEKWSGQ